MDGAFLVVLGGCGKVVGGLDIWFWVVTGCVEGTTGGEFGLETGSEVIDLMEI